MSKVTSKYQVSVPKALADRIGIAPGDEIDWQVIGGALQITPARDAEPLTAQQRRAMWDARIKRQHERERSHATPKKGSRAWMRADLYEPSRGRRH